MFGIYDGHAGGKCSKAVASTLPDILMQQAGYEQNLPSALQQAYHATNDEFLKVAERLKLHDGSTGITAILRDMKLTVANVGDCRAVLIRGGQAKQITVDHKPTDPVEMKRISALGGTVVNRMGVYRVNGVLAVSRAFGNRSLKQVIRPDADIFSIKLVPEDDYLVQASDGLWDVLRNKDVTDICYQFDHDGPQRIAQELVSIALARGSTDNTTALVVHLGPFIQRQLNLSSSVKKDFSASAVGGGVGAGWYDAKDDFSRATVASNASPSRPLSRMFGSLLRSSAGSPVGDDVDDPELAQHAPLVKRGSGSGSGSGILDMLWSDRGSSKTPTSGAMTPSPPSASPIQMPMKRLV
jgi:protein phosphatase 1L